MFTDSQSPWTFERDEVDLLEEDIDDLYDSHQSLDGKIKTMEEAVILEQLETEERAEAEFALHVDVKWLSKRKEEKQAWEKSFQPEQDLSCDTERPPFYETLFRFVDQVFLFATDLHKRGGNAAEHAFRVRMNIKMVPIKCAIAMSEETHEDPLSQAMAKKEYKLALVYLDRILISLAFLGAEGNDHAHAFLAPGIQMKRVLQQHLTRLGNHRSGFLQGDE